MTESDCKYCEQKISIPRRSLESKFSLGQQYVEFLSPYELQVYMSEKPGYDRNIFRPPTLLTSFEEKLPFYMRSMPLPIFEN